MPNEYALKQSRIIVENKASRSQVYREACYQLLSRLNLISEETISDKKLTDDDMDIANKLAAYYLEIEKNGRPKCPNPYIV